MKIIITDGYTLNPGDIDWAPLNELGSAVYYDRTAKIETISRTFDAEIIVANKTIINADVIAAAAELKMIAVTATGYNNVDVSAAAERSIPVCNVPGYGTFSVAQHTFALLLELTNHVGSTAAGVSQGKWSEASDWCYTNQPLTELYGKTFGIIGMGEIGRRVAMIAEAFGMHIIYYRGNGEGLNATKVSLHDLFMQSDVVSLHCPLTLINNGFVNSELLELMKPTAFLINTARGQLINEKDLARALHQRRIAGAALDVLSAEPPTADNPLTGIPNCIITPHNAWMSAEARKRILSVTAENISAFINGTPQNVVNAALLQ